MIKLIIGIPLLGLIINNIIPGRINKSREINMGVSILTLYINFWILLIFNSNNIEYQLRDSILLSFNNIEYTRLTLGVDGINLALITLVCILEPIFMLLTKGEVINYQETTQGDERKRLINLILISKILILILFLTLDLFVFFVTFEVLLIPIFILISRYGSQYKYYLPRLEAGFRLFMYTMVGSSLMLIAIIILYIKYGTSNNELLNIKISNDIMNSSNLVLLKVVWGFLFFSFLIKIPMFPFHTWLPLAHSDAPTIGSVILAAILLKLASYGILRYSLYLFQPTNFTITTTFESTSNSIYSSLLPLIYILAILSIIYSSLIPLRAIFDFKKIIAYSSIVHMNFSIFGFFSNDLSGLTGGTLLMFTHAFISSSLFLLIGFLYKRYHSRFLPYYQGLTLTMPLFSFFFLFFSLANISLPFCSSFLSEFLILTASFHFNPFLSGILLISLVFSSSFVIWFANRLLFGSISPAIISAGSKDLSAIELYSILPFFFFTLYFAFFPQSLITLFSLPLLLFI